MNTIFFTPSAIFLFFLLVIGGQMAKAQEANLSLKAEKFPEFSWETMPLYMHVRKSTKFTAEEITFMSKYPLITFEKSTGHQSYGSTEQGVINASKAIKEQNPKTKILYYKNVVINWPSYQEDAVFVKKNPNVLLKDQQGKMAVMPNKKTGFYDLSQEKVRAFWMNHVTKMAAEPSIDGLFLDANIKVLVPAFFNSRIGPEKRKEVEKGYFLMMDKMQRELGEKNLLLANILRVRPEFEDNGSAFLKYFSGSYIEGFEHQNFGMTYADYLAAGIETVQQSAREGKLIAMSLGLGKALKNTTVGIDDKRGNIELDDAFNARLDYLLAIFLVCAEKHSYVYPHAGYSANEKGKKNDSSVWLKTFPQYEKKLGAPKGPAQRMGYIYTRSFEYLDVWLDIEHKKATLDWK